jgi:hypothetical protein
VTALPVTAAYHRPRRRGRGEGEEKEGEGKRSGGERTVDRHYKHHMYDYIISLYLIYGQWSLAKQNICREVGFKYIISNI